MEIVEASQRQLTCLDYAYDKGVRGALTFFKYLFCGSRIGGIIAEFFCAPISFIKSVYHYVLGRVSVENFRVGGLNPQDLKALKPHKVAIVYIHGCMANQGTWMHMAKKMEKAGIGPGFTIDLNGKAYPWTYDTSYNRYVADIKVVESEISKLSKRYSEQGLEAPKFIVVGHSRGGALAQELRENSDVAKIISIGHPSYHHHDKIYDIEGEYDALVRPNSRQEKTHRALFRSTHLSLLYDRDVTAKVKDICQNVVKTI